MDFRKFAITQFKHHVQNDAYISSELKNILVKEVHPAISNFINNLSSELKKVQMVRIKKGKKPADETQLRWLVAEMTRVFIHGLEAEARKRYETDAEKFRKQREAQKVNEFDQTLAGNAQGVFAEMGVTTNAEIDKEREVGGPKA